MDVSQYQRRQYPTPPCWHLAADVLCRERGMPHASGELLRLALHAGTDEWRQVSAGQDFAVVLMARRPGPPAHCGIWYQGRVLHADGRLVMWEASHVIADRYRHLEFWIHDGHH